MTTLAGMSGTNPRDFLATLGLLRILSASNHDARLAFRHDGRFSPEIDSADRRSLADLVARDAADQAGPQPWRLEYQKAEKKGAKSVADLKPPPDAFREFLCSAVASWCRDRREAAEYAAAFATDVAVDGKGNTKPTAFHFTAANQHFLDTVEKIRCRIDRDWCEEALFKGGANRSGPNLRWDPAADRAYALMAADPNEEGTAVNAPLEWLAFRALPLLPVVPRRSRARPRAETTAVGRRNGKVEFCWPLWSTAASLPTVTSLIRMDWWQDDRDRGSIAVIAICHSEIRRSSEGFGNFGPSSVTT